MGRMYPPDEVAQEYLPPREIDSETDYVGKFGAWLTVWDKFKYLVPALGGIILGLGLVYGLDWVDDKYSIRAKVKAYFSSASEDATKNESIKCCERGLVQDVPVSQKSSYFVVCPFCGTQFDVTEFVQRYSAFDCDCPNVNCRLILHVENSH